MRTVELSAGEAGSDDVELKTDLVKDGIGNEESWLSPGRGGGLWDQEWESSISNS